MLYIGGVAMSGEFMAILYRVTRDNEDATKLTLECDAQQITDINNIPSQVLLKVKWETEKG